MKKRTLNIIFALIIVVVGPNVYADGTKRKKDKESGKEAAEKVIYRVSESFDTDLRLENWMTEFRGFNSNESFYEENLEMENWMTEAFEVETELAMDTELVLEEWMTETFEIEEMEKDMQLENWMLQPFSVSLENFQENELVLEDWMLKF